MIIFFLVLYSFLKFCPVILAAIYCHTQNLAGQAEGEAGARMKRDSGRREEARATVARQARFTRVEVDHAAWDPQLTNTPTSRDLMHCASHCLTLKDRTL